MFAGVRVVWSARQIDYHVLTHYVIVTLKYNIVLYTQSVNDAITIRSNYKTVNRTTDSIINITHKGVIRGWLNNTFTSDSDGHWKTEDSKITFYVKDSKLLIPEDLGWVQSRHYNNWDVQFQ